jgi:hypothetical protein
VCSLFSLENAEYWTNKLCQLLIDRGVSVHTRNKEDRTPLLHLAACVAPNVSTANGLRVLLSHGADLTRRTATATVCCIC